MEFGRFLNLYRNKRNITLDVLCEGLCSSGMLDRIERGERNAGKQLRDCLLERLGVSSNEYETYLGCEEYAEWELQQKIVRMLDDRDISRAESCLVEYEKKYCTKTGTMWETAGEIFAGQIYSEQEKRDEKLTDRLRWQFYLCMKGMCMKLSDSPAAELRALYEKAVKLTVPEIDRKEIMDMVLSPKELNMILEYTYWKNMDSDEKTDCVPVYESIVDYLKREGVEDNSQVEIYPKAIFYLCCELFRSAGEETKRYGHILELCDSAIELLRDTMRMYYLWELLDLKEQIIGVLIQIRKERGAEKKQGILEGKLDEVKEWKAMLEILQNEFQIPKRTVSECWLHYGQDTYCIGDIIRIRRKMLGMSRKELCDGICSLDTLRRLESCQKNTQMPIVKELSRRLKLPEENERTELVTASIEIHDLEREIRYDLNERRYNVALEKLARVRQLADMDNPVNRQWMLLLESISRFRLGYIDEAICGQCVREALACTLPKEILQECEEREYYLTNSEMACIYRIAILQGISNSEQAFSDMLPVYKIMQEIEGRETERNHIRTYELLMVFASRLLCDLDRNEEAKKQNAKILKTCLHMGRLNAVYVIYHDLWRIQYFAMKKNDPEKAGKIWVEKLKICLSLSHFCRSVFYEEQFFRRIQSFSEDDI